MCFGRTHVIARAAGARLVGRAGVARVVKDGHVGLLDPRRMFDGRCLRACERRPLRHPLFEVARAKAEHLKQQAVILLGFTDPLHANAASGRLGPGVDRP